MSSSAAAKQKASHRPGFGSVIGQSRAIRDAIDMAARVADSRIPTILLVGETGTGKELFAHGIHNASRRSGEPFVPVNCAAIPPQLLESELFGHERGAFTDAHAQKRGLLELAGEGTVLLDEVAELPLALQAKLLRALEDRRVRRIGGIEDVPIRCRIIAATNSPLERAVEDGLFREDLFYRLSGFRVLLPPLRERYGDIRLLADHFLQRFAEHHQEARKKLLPETVVALRAHEWPGNVRELKNVIERAAVLSDDGVIRPEHIVIVRRVAPAPAPDSEAASIRIPPGGKSLEEIQLEAVQITLRMTGGNRSEAARILGISRPTLIRRLKDLDGRGGPPG